MINKTVADARTALTGLVSESIIIGAPQTDFERRIDDVFHKLAQNPRDVSDKEVEMIVRHKESQIINPDTYFSHCVKVGRILSSAIRQLQENILIN